jgi:phosphohistidine phosphatase
VDLILWRHAEAEPGEPDLGRRLTPKGEKQARRMAEWLHAHLPDSAKIVASPAARAQQTAQALAELSRRKLKTLDAIAPGASADEVLAAVDWPDGKSPVVVVGHQPTLGWVASKVMTGEELPWSIKKAAVWWLQSRSREDDQPVMLRAVISPDLL